MRRVTVERPAATTGGAFCFGGAMKTLIAVLALTLLVVPMLAGIRLLRRLPRERADRDR